ncbi:MAG: hypothetical protein VX505_07455 [Chloroflexota bacterium]|nr:hypothetical protein [Chloroflexota bacterium]
MVTENIGKSWTFRVAIVGLWVLNIVNWVAEAMAVSLDKSLKMGRWFLLREHRT